METTERLATYASSMQHNVKHAKICFGVNVEKPDRLINHLVLTEKHFIYTSKLKSILPSFQSFLQIVNTQKKLNIVIKTNGKLFKFKHIIEVIFVIL